MAGGGIFSFIFNATAILSAINGVHVTPYSKEIKNNGAQKWVTNAIGVLGELEAKFMETSTQKKKNEKFMKLENSDSESEIENTESLQYFPEELNFGKTKMGRKGGVDLQQKRIELPEERRKLKAEATPEESCPSSRLYSSALAEGYKEEGIMRWIPQKDKYLVMHCSYGRLSNRVICYRHAINLAGFMNRTLIFSTDTDEISYHYDRRVAFDMSHVRECFGKNTIMSAEEYVEIYGKPIVVDKVYCLGEYPCGIKRNSMEPYESRFPTWKSIKIRPGILAEISRITYPRMDKARDILQNISENVLYMGELYLSHMDGLSRSVSWDSPFIRSKKCKTLLSVQPHIAVIEAGKNYVKEVFKNEPFMGVHLRRGDFERWCADKENGCYRPIDDVLSCLKKRMIINNISSIFLATNTKAEELDTITKAFETEKNKFRLVRLGQFEENKNSEWAKPLRDANLNSSQLLDIVLEKTICTLSTVFVGTVRSTFSEDIERMRYGFKTANCRDSMLCDSVEIKDS